jgi:TonB family protein
MIKEKWGDPCAKDLSTGDCDYKSARLVVEFGILKNGRVPYVTVIQGAGWQIYDDYAVNAIRLGQPFPPVPPELIERAASGSSGVRIVGTFTYILEGSSLKNELR